MANTAVSTSSWQSAAVTRLTGRLKKVNSADTVVVCTIGPDRAPHDKVVHLANLVAPKVAVYTFETKQIDEPLGWEGREVLRKEFIGTEVTVEVEHHAAKSVSGYVYKGKGTEGESLNEIAVARGLASVKEKCIEVKDLVMHQQLTRTRGWPCCKSSVSLYGFQVNKKSEKYDKLKELQEKAKAAKLGIWADDRASKRVRDIVWTISDGMNLFDKYNGKSLDAIVEGVCPNAAGVRVFVQLDGTFYYLTVMLAGIRGPTEESKLRPRAIYFIESGLLHQPDIKLVLNGAGNNGQLLGRIIHPQYDIVQELLANGLAQIQDWMLTSMDPKDVTRLREAEQSAKQGNLGVWKDYKEGPKTTSLLSNSMTAKVVEVVASDMLVVKDASNNLKKIFLSSIRPPRKESQTKEPQAKLTMAQKMFQQPLLFEAREFLRKELIGKNVKVHTDFIQPKSEMYPEKVCCTVTINGKNIAEALVSRGLASVVRYRQDNDQRSPHYFELQMAEHTAQKNRVGLYAKKEPEPMKVAELQGEPIKSKQYFTSLQRGNPNTAIVEFVSSGSRLRVYCAKHSCVFPFLLNGIQCPRAGRLEPNGQSAPGGDAYGNEALRLTKDQCLQHEISIDVESQDKNGAMIGKAVVAGKNLAVELVAAGLATVHRYSAEKLSYYKDLCDAEELAKAKKLCLWENCVEEVKEEEKEVIEEVLEDNKSERKVEFKTVQVSEITPSGTKFYVQYIADRAKFLEMSKKLQEELKNPTVAGTFKRGDRAAAKFTDGHWYRVKIEKLSPTKAELLYVDFGNRGECSPSELQRLPAFCATTPSVAHPVNLAFVKMPKDEDEMENARRAFAKDVESEVKMNIEYKNQDETYVTLHVGDSDIGRGLIADGYAFFEPRRGERYAEICKEYQEAQDKAKNEHLNLWEYGDSREDEEDRR
ncbi:hypothetical protein BIW11_06545 [Tropilaelaps mercedesae]|uniref:Uncharacterized protein n=1 Tax=Tropilaelaps mercedesae TaxID=418985 RepID=A0A1V9XXL8_9ACAR|nr:hypothetical protein BIW11_06545 [Tropilaelaps mercedesae]